MEKGDNAAKVVLPITDTPLYHIFQYISQQSGVEIYNYCFVLAQECNIWKKKIKNAKIKEKIEQKDKETLDDFFEEATKKFEPKYEKWDKKTSLTFMEFCEILEQYYQKMESKSNSNFQFLRGSTVKFRLENNLKDKRIRDINPSYDEYIHLLINSYTDKNPNYNYLDDTIQVDHVLSVKVFYAICILINKSQQVRTYSFDRYYSLKSWLNKCWNFEPLPSKINNMKGKIEKELISIIMGLTGLEFDAETEFKEDTYLQYFYHFVGVLNKKSKQNSLNQMTQFKDALHTFLNNFKQVNIINKHYECSKNCYCQTEVLSKHERLNTFHLFINYDIGNFTFATKLADTEEVNKYIAKYKNKKPMSTKKRKRLEEIENITNGSK